MSEWKGRALVLGMSDGLTWAGTLSGALTGVMGVAGALADRYHTQTFRVGMYTAAMGVLLLTLGRVLLWAAPPPTTSGRKGKP